MADYELSRPPGLYWPLNYWFLWWPGYFSSFGFPSSNTIFLVPNDDRINAVQFECRDVVIDDDERVINVQ